MKPIRFNPVCKRLFPLWLMLLCGQGIAAENTVQVTLENFPRAETDLYFNKRVQQIGLGNFVHARSMTSIDQQTVVRMNRDTIYSSGVFDLAAGEVTITLPDPGERYLSLHVISEQHYTVDVAYTPGKHTYSQDRVGTRYAIAILRILADPTDDNDMRAANALQDKIVVRQESPGHWQMPNWDSAAQTKIRDTLKTLGSMSDNSLHQMFGTKDSVNPLYHLIGTAAGWGGLPVQDAVYKSFHTPDNDGKTPHELTLRDVPVDGFWSVSVYNPEGFFVKNPQQAYTVNNLTAKANADGSHTIHFGGDPKANNYLAIMPGWNCVVRLYRPRQEVLDEKWVLPVAEPVGKGH